MDNCSSLHLLPQAYAVHESHAAVAHSDVVGKDRLNNAAVIVADDP